MNIKEIIQTTVTPNEPGLEHKSDNSSKKLKGAHSVSNCNPINALPPGDSANGSVPSRIRNVGLITGQDGNHGADKDQSIIASLIPGSSIEEIEEASTEGPSGKNCAYTVAVYDTKGDSTCETESLSGDDEDKIEDGAFYTALTGNEDGSPLYEKPFNNHNNIIWDEIHASEVAKNSHLSQEEITQMIASDNRLKQINADEALAQQLQCME